MQKLFQYYTPVYIQKPEEVLVECVGFNRICYSVIVRDTEYDICEQAAKNWWASKKKGSYGKGLLNTSKDPYRVERIGILGQMGWGKLIHQPVDVGYREGGDSCDFMICGKTLDVKCNSRLNTKNPAGFIIAYDNEDDKIHNKNYKANIYDVHVISYIEHDNPQTRYAKIVYVGSIFGSWIRKNKKNLLFPSRLSTQSHWNIELPYYESRDIADVYKWCREK
jgi:hypothetical protein